VLGSQGDYGISQRTDASYVLPDRPWEVPQGRRIPRFAPHAGGAILGT
jgi:hypothetical protein